jgi:5-methylcytosine-specific restriction endonuclease McrA
MSTCNRIPSLRRQAFNRQGGFCYYCDVRMWLNSPEELDLPKGSAAASRLQCTAEHLVPRSDGGRELATNIVAACAHCNHTRHRQKRPPEPPQYRAKVRGRVAQGGWHHPWVFDRGLLRSTGSAGTADPGVEHTV